MNIQEILNQYDSMFDVESLESIELYLKNNIEKALNENNVSNAQSDTENEKYYFCSTLFE